MKHDERGMPVMHTYVLAAVGGEACSTGRAVDSCEPCSPALDGKSLELPGVALAGSRGSVMFVSLGSGELRGFHSWADPAQ